jgi:serine/threonine protein kinase
MRRLSPERMASFLGMGYRSTLLPRDPICLNVSKLYCENDEVCKQRFLMSKQLGRGAYGRVYEACHDDVCDYIAKWIPIPGMMKLDEIQREIDIQFVASGTGISPKIKQVLICDNGVLIIMDRMKQTLGDYLTEKKLTDDEKTLILFKITTVLNNFHLLGYTHNDTHTNNFMIDKNDDVKLIDFGKAVKWNSSTFENIELDLAYLLNELIRRPFNFNEHVLRFASLQLKKTKLIIKQKRNPVQTINISAALGKREQIMERNRERRIQRLRNKEIIEAKKAGVIVVEDVSESETETETSSEESEPETVTQLD